MDDRETIFLVEDNINDQALTIRAIERLGAGCTIIALKDGVEAIDYLLGRGSFTGRDVTDMPKVILMDLKMPKSGGLEALKQIRAEKQLKLLPVVVLTSSSEESGIINSYKNGVNSYIRKPVDFTHFKEMISRIVIYWLTLNETVRT